MAEDVIARGLRTETWKVDSDGTVLNHPLIFSLLISMA
jgi:hypothetical protein